MAKPTKTKEMKPKADEDASAPSPDKSGGGLIDLKTIILIVVVLFSSLLSTAGAGYLMTTMFIIPEINKLSHASGDGEEAEGEEGGHHDPASTEVPASNIGMNLELDEFTVNLGDDPNLEGSQFLRAKVSLSIKVPDAQNCYAPAGEHHAMHLSPQHASDSLAQLSIQNGTVLGGASPVDATLLANGGGEAGPSCEDLFKTNMSKYVPTVRDIVNVSLMKRTATILASIEGQEALKDEIKQQLSQIMAPDYTVIRVNFQDFIIQK